MTPRDRELVELIPRLRRYARALTGHADQAEDLVQDCMERAWSRIHMWRPGSDLRAWLFTIMHNLHANARRRAALRPEVQLPEWGLGSVHPIQEHAAEFRSILAALHHLPMEQREVLLLVGLEGLAYREAADVLGLPIGTVMSRLARGRERLRQLTEGEAMLKRSS